MCCRFDANPSKDYEMDRTTSFRHRQHEYKNQNFKSQKKTYFNSELYDSESFHRIEIG